MGELAYALCPKTAGGESPHRQDLYQIRLNAHIIETFGGTSLQDFGLGDSAVN